METELEKSEDGKLLGSPEKPKERRRSQSAHNVESRKQSAENSPSSDSLKQFKPWINGDRWRELKKMSETAVKEKKVFLIKGGGFPAIRQALVERGWIEKFDTHKSRVNTLYPNSGDECSLVKSLSESEKQLKIKCEKSIMHKFLEHQPVDFLWTAKRDKYDWMMTKRDVIISRFSRSNFTSKEGLCSSLNQMYWYTEPGVAYTNFPRCYNLHNQEQLEEFIDDFRITGCIGLLKWFIITYANVGKEGIVSQNGKIPFSAMDFAFSRLEEYLYFASHEDIDESDDRSKHVWEHEWDQFLTHHYLAIHENVKFMEDEEVCLSVLEQKSEKLLKSMSKYWPQIEIDGIMNIWIVKPGNKCRGRGIQLMNNIKDIVGIVNFPLVAKTRFVVQKYIETPLIIYNTKFDIRQWFLITCSQPMTIWMYKDSYLRFSSQIFNLTNYHESVHLTNNAVQTKYKNHVQRDKALPDENMWDCHTFKTYLRQIGQSDMWDTRIYPGMRECLIGTMLACQESMDRRQNSFELYGADFMLTEDFTPWLIEINSSPDLAPTTSVTARLCPQCLEDIIKVVVDRRTNPDANTGMFELVYKQVVPRAPAYLGLSLSLSGKKIFKKPKPEKPKVERELTPPTPKLKPQDEPPSKESENIISPLLQDLFAWLKPYEAREKSAKEIEKPVPSVQHTLTVVKSGLLMKASKSKRKISGHHSSSKNYSRKKDKLQSAQLKTPHYCCKIENENLSKNSKPNQKENKKFVDRIYWTDPASMKSVGNKRCYIEPAAWERDTASILRSCTSSISQKTETKSLNQVTPRIFSPGITDYNKMQSPMRRRNTFVESENKSMNSSTSRSNVKRSKQVKNDAVPKTMKECNNNNVSFKRGNSFYGPYKTVQTPDDSQA